MLEQLLDFSRLDANRMSVEPQNRGAHGAIRDATWHNADARRRRKIKHAGVARLTLPADPIGSVTTDVSKSPTGPDQSLRGDSSQVHHKSGEVRLSVPESARPGDVEWDRHRRRHRRAEHPGPPPRIFDRSGRSMVAREPATDSGMGTGSPRHRKYGPTSGQEPWKWRERAGSKGMHLPLFWLPRQPQTSAGPVPKRSLSSLPESSPPAPQRPAAPGPRRFRTTTGMEINPSRTSPDVLSGPHHNLPLARKIMNRSNGSLSGRICDELVDPCNPRSTSRRDPRAPARDPSFRESR
jgi:hypothetical protein